MNGKHVVVGKVEHSMRLNEKPLRSWIIFKENGAVESAHCNCMAGLGEACSHVGAIMWKIEHSTKCRCEATVTDEFAY